MRTLPSLLALSLVVLLPLHYLRAAWILLEDFDTLSVGDVNGQGTWVADNGSTTVVVDPLGGPNQVLQSQGSNGGGHPDFGVNTAYMPLPSSIANNTTATLFFRFRLDSISDANASFGLSDSATPSLDFNFTDYEVQAGAAAGNVRVRDQGSFETVTQSGSFNSDIWYSSWLVVDNAADTWSWYVLGGSFLTQATLDSGVDAINFRNGTAANALQSILIKAGTIPSSTVWYDDFHLDTTGENLSEPFGVTAQYLLPEPSTFVGLILGSIVLRWSGTRTHRRKSS